MLYTYLLYFLYYVLSIGGLVTVSIGRSGVPNTSQQRASKHSTSLVGVGWGLFYSSFIYGIRIMSWSGPQADAHAAILALTMVTTIFMAMSLFVGPAISDDLAGRLKERAKAA